MQYSKEILFFCKCFINRINLIEDMEYNVRD